MKGFWANYFEGNFCVEISLHGNENKDSFGTNHEIVVIDRVLFGNVWPRWNVVISYDYNWSRRWRPWRILQCWDWNEAGFNCPETEENYDLGDCKNSVRDYKEQIENCFRVSCYLNANIKGTKCQIFAKPNSETVRFFVKRCYTRVFQRKWCMNQNNLFLVSQKELWSIQEIIWLVRETMTERTFLSRNTLCFKITTQVYVKEHTFEYEVIYCHIGHVNGVLRGQT